MLAQGVKIDNQSEKSLKILQYATSYPNPRINGNTASVMGKSLIKAVLYISFCIDLSYVLWYLFLQANRKGESHNEGAF